MATQRQMNALLLPGAVRSVQNQTSATQALLGQSAGRPVTKKRTTKKKRVVRKKRAKTAGKKRARKAPKGRLKKGSPAAKRRMAQLRAMQKRKRR